jgi:hypothetical protein
MTSRDVAFDDHGIRTSTEMPRVETAEIRRHDTANTFQPRTPFLGGGVVCFNESISNVGGRSSGVLIAQSVVLSTERSSHRSEQ